MAGGESTKLWPLTQQLPSAMLPIVNKPVMAYGIELLIQHGIKNISVGLSHLAGMIESHFGNGKRWGVSLNYILQGEALGTASTLNLARHYLNETFIVLPGDCIYKLDIAAALAEHRSRHSMASIVSLATEHGAADQTSSAAATPTGIYLFEPQIFDLLPNDKAFDIDTGLLPSLHTAGFPVHLIEMEGYFNPLLTFVDYQKAQWDVLQYERNGNSTLFASSLAGRQIRPGVWRGRKTNIHATARLIPPVYIGENCKVQKGVELGPCTVLGNNVVVDKDATVGNAIVLENTYVGELVHIDRRIVQGQLVIDQQTGHHVRVADHFVLDEVAQTVNLALQRSLDVIVAGTILILLSPLILLTALLLVLTTGQAFRPVGRIAGYKDADGNVIYRAYTLLHFNTRRREGNQTDFGCLIEQIEWERVPELWNVLKGDIHLVGTMPTAMEASLRANEPWHQARYECEPGFTGLWYIQMRPNSNLEELLMADVYYVATRSWKNDLRLIGKTPLNWFYRVFVGYDEILIETVHET